MNCQLKSTAAHSLACVALASAVIATTVGCVRHSAPEMNSAQSPQTQAAPAEQSPSANAMRAHIDPKTGELREPTPEELAAEAQAESQKKQAAGANVQAEQPTSRERRTPSGAVEIPLDPSTDRPLQACVDAHGNVKMDHDCESARPKP